MPIASGRIRDRTARRDSQAGVLEPQFDRPTGMSVANGRDFPAIIGVEQTFRLDDPLPRDIDEVEHIGMVDRIVQLDRFVCELRW